MNNTENKRRLIVITDGDGTNMSVTRSNLTRIYDVLTAPTAEKLFRLLERVTPDMILLNKSIPDRDVFEVAKNLKSNKNTVQIPFIILDSVTDPDNEIKGLKLGAADYITKPISKDLFLHRIGLHMQLEKQKKDLEVALSREEGHLQAHKQNRIQLTKLQMLLKASKIDMWDLAINKDDPINSINEVKWSDGIRHILGYADEKEYPNLIDSLRDRLHPDDRDRTINSFINHVIDKTGNTPYNLEYRVKKKNGEYAFFQATGDTIRDKDGNPLRYVGAHMDITDTKKLLLDNEIQLTKLHLMLKATKIFLWDMEIAKGDTDPVNDSRPFSWSDDFRNMLGFTDENDFPNTVGSLNERLHPDDREMNIKAFERHLMDKSGLTPYNVEIRVMKKDGVYAYFRASGETIRDLEGNPVRVAGAFMDISETKRLIAEIERQKIEAEVANQGKSTFLANMSHEMRTPLNAILGLSELSLETGAMSDDDYTNLEKIRGAGMTLLNIVSDILDISKIETGKFELIPIDYDTPSLINDTITQSILHIGEKPIRFVLDVDESLPARLFGDELRIKQILNNLLSNAFKYTQQGEVSLSMDYMREGESVWLTAKIRDTGIGIKPENLALLFDDYVQVDTSANRKIMGTGLGLSIAKRLVESMDGRILAESEYSKGSVFTVLLRQKHVTDETIGPEVAESLKNFYYIKQKNRRNSGITRLSLPYARVLVVDDVVTNLDVAKGFLKRYKMQVDCLTSGQASIDAIRRDSVRYDAIFMDHMMPEIDGVEALRQIRAIGTDYAKNIPVIALTANAIVGNEDMFLGKGFQAFISKPIELARLDAVIREWVRDREKDKLYSQSGKNGLYQAAKKYDLDWHEWSKGIELNIEKGIKRFGDDEEAYIDILRSYAKNIPSLLETVQAVDADHQADYAVIVHGIKGSSYGICADKTGGMAEALEKAAKKGDFAFVGANNAAFIESARLLVRDIEEILEKIASEQPKVKREQPDQEVLERLRDACIHHEMDDVDTLMAELETFEYESGSDLVAWLRDNADQMNYADIAEKLSV